MAAPIVKAAGKVAAARKDIETEAEKAAKAIREYVADEQRARANANASPELIKSREQLAKASEALKLGLNAEADALIELATSAALSTEELQKVAAAQEELLNMPASAGDAVFTWADQFESRLQEVDDAFLDISYSIDDVFRGLKNRDWIGGAGGLLRAIKQIKAAFGPGGTTAGKFGAVAAVGQAAGNAIGGKLGGALSGAAGGASLGFTLGGPVGAGIGAVVGGIAGLFGASKAKKRAKKEAAARAKAEAEQKAAELAAAKRELELQVMELQGKTSEALAERRKDELAAMDASLRPLQEQAWALEDAAEAAQKAADLTAERTALERELLRLQDEGAAVALDRADALAAADESLRPVMQAIFDVIDAQAAAADAEAAHAALAEEWADKQAAADDAVTAAREAVADAAQEEVDALEDVAQRFEDLADGLAAVRKELSQDTLAGLDPRRQAGAARKAFDEIFARAKTGDEQALADLPDAIRNLVSTGGAIAPNARALEALRAEGRRAATIAEAAARARVTDAQKQITAINANVAATLGVTQAVKSLDQRFADLSNAIFEQASVMAHAVQAMDNLVAASTTAASNVVPLFPALPPPLDMAGIDAAVNPPVTAPAAGATVGSDTFAADVAAAIAESPVFAQLVVNTGFTARTLDDVTQGGDSLRTAVA